MTSPLVCTKWLYDNLDNPDVVVLDSSIDFQIPAETEKDKTNVIPGSLRFDYDTVFCDVESSLPHMMPSEQRFNEQAQALGLDNDSIIVVYDNSGTFASPRAYWMFKAMGHEKVFILDGGLTEWKRAGFHVVQHYRNMAKSDNFTGRLIPHYFVDADTVENEINNSSSQTVDARGLARFMAQTPEPREGVRSGHIPNSLCLPFATLMDSHKLKPQNELQAILETALECDKARYLFSCGSGVTACIVAVAAEICGYKNLSVYDGSWTEWGQEHHRPIATPTK
ncbi:sulfurtransferase [Vibrio agarivorans]|uniref:sulfurtransferase n=1 Tax=Vibrio agarivorans TaxID=153622 RepID=UPI0022320D88|nr:sulfurtransferase [Vibrio agarivorans]